MLPSAMTENVLNCIRCYANELDKYDINVLNSVLDSELGNDILDGTEILGKIAQAEKDYESYLRQKDYWYSEYMDASWHEIVYSDLCYYTYKYYEKLANDAAEDKAYWEGRGELLISISEELSGLFILGNEFRDCTKKGICQINTAFDVNTNTYLIGDMSWKDELQNRLVASVYTEAGRIDWNLVEQILAKDADAISDTEYILVAYAYMKADVDEFSNFFMMCRVPEEVDSFEFANLYLEHKLDVMSFATMRMMTLDPKKIDAICRQVNIYQTNLLALIRYGNLDESSESSLIIERNDVIQRITVARELNEIHSFWGYQEDNFFDFEYCDEGFGPYESVRVTYNSFAEAHELEPASIMSHTLTVINTLTDSGLSMLSKCELRDAELKELTSYSTAIVGDNIADEVLEIALQKIPFSGITLFGVGLAEDIQENERKYRFIVDSFDIHMTETIARFFDCCGNIILYDNNSIGLSIYEGRYTDQRVEGIGGLLDNKNLDTAL